MLVLNEIINKIHCGDSLEFLKQIPDGSIDCCITSPPYFGLRDYGVNGQIGLESSPEEYINKLVLLFRETRRCLKNDGTCWLNLGDSYFSPQNSNRNGCDGRLGGKTRGGGEYKTQKKESSLLRQKDLCGIPWRVAFALQADGWYLRQDIIWHKPNPMPESVTDRCTKAHEYIFLLTKNPKYYFNNEAIKEKAVWDLDGEGTIKRAERQKEGSKSNPDEWKNGIRHKNLLEKGQPVHTMHKLRVTYPNGKHKDGQQSPKVINGLRNKRSVWTVSTKPFKDAHFATFPEDLIVPMVKAGCPEKGIVLDPFMGAGTTALVAKKLLRNYIGVELNQEYIKIAEKRLAQDILI